MLDKNLNKKKIIGLSFLLLFLASAILMDKIPISNDSVNTIPEQDINERETKLPDDKILNPSISYSDYTWWDNDWDYRVSVNVSANGADQNNVPVELIVNFTELIADPELPDPNFQLNDESIRVIEYTSPTTTIEIACQFDKYSTYDNHSNAIGDVVWIMDGATDADDIREYFIYFDNGTDANIPSWPYTQDIRIWHEGFEDNFDKSTLVRLQPGTQDRHPNAHYVVDDVAARGDKSYQIVGNCWKAHDLTGSPIYIGGTPYTATAKMRFDDPAPNKDISGIGFWSSYSSPQAYDSYEIRGVQNWGRAGWTGSECKYRNDYYSSNTFFWYTFNLDSEISSNTIRYIVHIGDDDNDYGGFFNFTLYWDDISIWNQSVETVPNHMITTTIGEIEPISYTLELTCKDVDDNMVPDAQVYVTNQSYSIIKQGNSDDQGVVYFSNMTPGIWYNISVYYTQQGLSNPKTEMVNTTLLKIEGLNTFKELLLDIWTMNFTVYDVDEDPIQYGYLVINDGSSDVGKAYLDNLGNCTLRWLDLGSYDYRVYFDYSLLTDDSSYIYDEYLIESSTINRPSNYQRIDTLISKINFTIIDNNDDEFENCVLRIYNQSDFIPNMGAENKIIANLTCDDDGKSRLYALNDEVPLSSWGEYTVEFFFAGQLWDITNNTAKNFNFTLNRELSHYYKVLLTKDNYISNFTIISTNPTDLSTDVNYNEEISFECNFTTTDQSVPITSQSTPDYVYYQIFSDELVQLSGKIHTSFTENSPGNITIILNTTQIGLIGGKSYFLEFNAIKQGYQPPEAVRKFLYVIALPAELSIHEYGGTYAKITGVAEYYDEMVNISVRYYSVDTGDSLKGATLRYTWQYGSGDIDADPMNDDYYTFTIDTSTATTTGTYIFTIDASLDNYTYIGNRPVTLQILARKTTLNNESDPLDKIFNIYVQDYLNFTFVLRDLERENILGSLTQSYYRWYQISEAGGVIQGPSELIPLTEIENDQYVLDFDTETRQVGVYLLRLTMGKTNYESQDLDITLRILERTIDAEIDAPGFKDDQLNVVKGKKVTIEVELTDPTQGDIPIVGADVTLEIGNKEFEFDDKGDGKYELEFDTKDYEAFFTSNTLTGKIVIKKVNYEDEELDITIVIEMEEVADGIPMFYFIMVVGAIAAVVGSLATYKGIQIARIPSFVKKARSMKGAIKGRKDIPGSALSKTKGEMILNQFENEWEELGLSLSNTLGIERKKLKSLSESNNTITK
ncbi:MAG: hypothetical protein ACFFAO_04040 [Candidatus Hermodarchaeota archaeon]